MRRRVTGCWVLIEENDPARILGYYTLSAASVDAEEHQLHRRADPQEDRW
jgi:hypothetical protein